MTTEQPAAEAAEPQPDPVAALFTDLFPSAVLQAVRNPMGETVLTVNRRYIGLMMREAKDKPELGFDFLRCLTGVDQEALGIEVIYSLLSYKNRHKVHIKTLLPPKDLTVASVTSIWAGANWHERETAEMLGITFAGHPNPKHLLLDDDMEIHPLLKAHPLAPIELKQGYQTF